MYYAVIRHDGKIFHCSLETTTRMIVNPDLSSPANFLLYFRSRDPKSPYKSLTDMKVPFAFGFFTAFATVTFICSLPTLAQGPDPADGKAAGVLEDSGSATEKEVVTPAEATPTPSTLAW